MTPVIKVFLFLFPYVLTWWWWIVFVVWLTDERRLTLFPAGTIVRDPHHRESPTRRAGFEPAQNLSSGLVEWSCAVVITNTPRCHIKILFPYVLTFVKISLGREDFVKLSVPDIFTTSFHGVLKFSPMCLYFECILSDVKFPSKHLWLEKFVCLHFIWLDFNLDFNSLYKCLMKR